MRLRIIRLTAENGVQFEFWFLFSVDGDELAIADMQVDDSVSADDLLAAPEGWVA